MVWVYDRTESVLVATLMHASLIVSTVQTILTPATTGVAFLTWFFLLTAALWIAVAGIVAAGQGQRSGRPLLRRAA
jgi:hypothetical protein